MDKSSRHLANGRPPGVHSGCASLLVSSGAVVSESAEVPVSEDVLVRSGGAEFWVQVDDAGGPSPVGLGDVLSFDGVRKTVEEIGSQLSAACDRVKPSEAVVEFGLALTAKSGKLTGLLVDGEGEGSFKITLTWSGGRPGQP